MLRHAGKTWTLFICKPLPSGNMLKGAHRLVVWRMRKQFQREILHASLVGNAAAQAVGPRCVTVIRVMHKGQRQFDQDNLVAGCKPLLDALVHQDWLVDDRPQDMPRLEVYQNRTLDCTPTDRRAFGMVVPHVIVRLKDCA